MFGASNPFGQSTSSPFGTPTLFGQTNNATNNPFTSNAFGSSSPFASQTGSSMFGGTSTGVFGAIQSSSPLASTPAFGASSTPTFGSSIFGASSTPAFASGSSSFGGSSIFGQKPAFGGFGSTTNQTSPFGSTFQQSQIAFGNTTPAFGASSTPAFGATGTPAFSSTSTPAFGATSTPAFGPTTNTFGSSGSAFGSSSTPAFGSPGTSLFGASSTPIFGSSSAPAFGASNTVAFGSNTTPTFGASSTPSFSFGSLPAFGQSTSAFSSSPFGTMPSPFGIQSSPLGTQTTPTFGGACFSQSNFGGQRGGSRAAPYTPTAEVDGSGGTQPAGKLDSISAMPVYKDKSHDELRWEDYQLGDKGAQNFAGQPATGISFGAPAQSSPFGATSTFGQTTSNHFSSATASNPFAPKMANFGSTTFGVSSTPTFSSPFGPSSSPFGSTSSTPSLFGGTNNLALGASSSPSPFGASSTPILGASSSPSMFGSASAPAQSPAFVSGFNFGNTQSSTLFQSTTPSLGQTTSTFGLTTPIFGQTTTSAFGQPNPFTPSNGFGRNVFTSSSAPSLLNTSNPLGFGQTTTSGVFGNFAQTQPAASSGFGGVSNVFGQPVSQNNLVAQPMPGTNPFGTLPAIPRMLIDHAGSSPSIQYGISSMPVADKPSSLRVSPLLTSRHLSQRRIRLPPRKYYPKSDGLKIPFFSDDEETSSKPKADALFIPRENPRALVVSPLEQWPSRGAAEKHSLMKDISKSLHQNGKSSMEGSSPAAKDARGHDRHDEAPAENSGVDGQQSASPGKYRQKPNGVYEDHGQKGDSYITISGHRAGEAAIVYEHGADIEALMPKLRHADYYTEPRIQEIAAKERAEPSYCRHVKDFVVGRHGYGSIKFIGETDVRRLDLESIVQLNNKEVIVYMDESKKPPVGQGLNKLAEVTLLNIKCFNKKSGQQYMEGPRVERYREMLIKKAEDQGAEFVFYDPVKGEWKFRVNHFSRYGFENEGGDSSLASLLDWLVE